MSFNAEQIIKAVETGMKLFEVIQALVEAATDVLSEDDAAEVTEALKALQDKNDETYQRVMDKLKAAQGG